ncbi:MAG: DUF1013 domain-containing protein [Alphaproteobacteria bacterium]|nr:DUF1013 domain-containing protein [Alphaproteobacteria bacterium]
MVGTPLMRKATAVWLVDNTSLTFEQIATFCSMHPLEIKGIADGEVAQGIRGLDPITNGQLMRQEIERAQKDPNYKLHLTPLRSEMLDKKTKRGHRYTPLSRRQDRPNAILWLLRNWPGLKEAQIIRLIGTTKTTIQSIRSRNHWNSPNLQPHDPVTLGLCTQRELDTEVEKILKNSDKEKVAVEVETGVNGETLLPTEKTIFANENAKNKKEEDLKWKFEKTGDQDAEPVPADPQGNGE